MTGVFPTLSEAFLINVAATLLDQGHDVRVFAAGKQEAAQANKIYALYRLHQHTVYVGDPAPLRLVRELWTQLRSLPLKRFCELHYDTVLRPWRYKKRRLMLSPILEFEPDLLYCNFLGTADIYRPLRKYGVVPRLIVGVYGGDIAKQGLSYEYDEIFETADTIVAISNYIKRLLIKKGVSEAKVDVIPLPVFTDEFSAKSEEDYMRTSESLHILSVARLVEKKGIEYGIMAMHCLMNRGGRFRYSIVGAGPLKEKLNRMIQELGLEDSVELLGPKNHEELDEIYRFADVLLVPSITAHDGDTEGQCVVIQEAGSVGLPVIVTDHDGLPEAVDHEITGFVVPEADPKAIAGAVEEFLKEPRLVQTMGRRHQAMVREVYSTVTIGIQLGRMIGSQ